MAGAHYNYYIKQGKVNELHLHVMAKILAETGIAIIPFYNFQFLGHRRHCILDAFVNAILYFTFVFVITLTSIRKKACNMQGCLLIYDLFAV